MAQGGSPVMRVELGERHGACVLTVHGEIDMATAPQLTEAVDGVLREHVARLVVDLGPVSFLASAGLAVLVETNNRVEEQGGKLIVVAHGGIGRTIQITGLDEVLTITETLDAAIDVADNEVRRRYTTFGRAETDLG